MNPQHYATRRRLLSYTALTAAGLALTGCATGSPPAQYAEDAKLVGDALVALVTKLGSVAGLTPATLARYTSYASQAATLAGQVAAALTRDAAEPLVVQLVGVAQAALDALAGSSGVIPPEVATALRAVSALLPVLQVAVGLLAAPRGAMAPEDARRVLRALRG